MHREGRCSAPSALIVFPPNVHSTRLTDICIIRLEGSQLAGDSYSFYILTFVRVCHVCRMFCYYNWELLLLYKFSSGKLEINRFAQPVKTLGENRSKHNIHTPSRKTIIRYKGVYLWISLTVPTPCAQKLFLLIRGDTFHLQWLARVVEKHCLCSEVFLKIGQCNSCQ